MGLPFWVGLLTRLGLETGFSADDIVSTQFKDSRAGLEYDVRHKDCSYIVKSPWFCDYAEEVICRDDIVIEHVFIPVRGLNAAAESRRHVFKSSVSNLPFVSRLKQMIRPRKFGGGLWHTRSSKQGRQEEILLRQIYKLMLAISDTTVPVTFMRYPRIIKDSQYLIDKLKPVLGNITYKSFCSVFSKTVRPELVHSFDKNDY